MGTELPPGVYSFRCEESSAAKPRRFREHRQTLPGLPGVTQGSQAESIMKKMSAIVLGAIVTLLLVSSCSGRETSPEAGVGPATGPETGAESAANLASIGGAQDVWPFTFGFDADRTKVEQALGPPESTQDDGNVTTWSYPGLDLDFFREETGETEYLIAAHITEDAEVRGEPIALRGGLHLGMSRDEALQLLGEPGLEAGRAIVFFYYTTTIELLIRNNTVREVVLARAMP